MLSVDTSQITIEGSGDGISSGREGMTGAISTSAAEEI